VTNVQYNAKCNKITLKPKKMHINYCHQPFITVVRNKKKKKTEAYSCRLLLDVFQPIGISSHNITAER
jgi:hypothetical protein